MTPQEKATYDAAMRASADMNATATVLEEQARKLRATAVDVWRAAVENSSIALEEVQQRSCKSKGRYKTAKGAGDAAAVYSARNGDKLRVYPCNFCQGFHLTKETLETFTGVER